MHRMDAHTVLVNAGYTQVEASQILDHAMQTGSTLTAPRNCPSLFVDVNDSLDDWRIMENDSGIIYNLATIF